MAGRFENQFVNLRLNLTRDLHLKLTRLLAGLWPNLIFFFQSFDPPVVKSNV